MSFSLFIFIVELIIQHIIDTAWLGMEFFFSNPTNPPRLETDIRILKLDFSRVSEIFLKTQVGFLRNF